MSFFTSVMAGGVGRLRQTESIGASLAALQEARDICRVRFFFLMGLFATEVSWAQALTVDSVNSPYVITTATSVSQVRVAPGGVLVVNAELTVNGDMVVQGSGRVTVDPWPKTLNLIVAGTLTIDVDGVIEADGKGLKGAPGGTFGNDCGETLDPVTLTVRTGPCGGLEGASHASPGGGPTPAPVYGNPGLATPGGGGNGAYYVGAGIGGDGGGVVRITANALVADGQLRANGQDGRSNGGFGGGGAGGSIALSVQSFSGAGSLSANGGNGDGGGTGGAGRIIVSYSTWSFTGSLSVLQGGVSAGTARLFNATLNQLRIEIPTIFKGGETYDSVILSPAASLRIEGRANINMPLTVPAGAVVTLAGPNALDGLSIKRVDGTLEVTSSVTQTTDLVLTGQVTLDGQLTVANLEMTSGAVITHSAQVTLMHLIVPGRLNLVAGARIQAVGKGYPGGSKNGLYASEGVTIEPVNGTRAPGSGKTNGGSHGGLGGHNAAGEALAPTYDNPAQPIYAGGGGGASYHQTTNSFADGGSGGGVLRLTVGDFVLNGIISADGDPGTFDLGTVPAGPPGGGAGGTVVLIADTLGGTGGIYARGGAAGQSTGAGGGGGIINVSTASTDSTIMFSAAGGTGQFPGGPGVVVQTTRMKTGAPRLTSTPSNTGYCGVPYRYSGLGVPTVTGNAPITFSVSGVEGGPAPEGLTVDADTGEFAWSPTASQKGPNAIVLIAQNAQGIERQVFEVIVDCPGPKNVPVGCACSAHDSAGALSWLLLLLAAFALGRRV